METPEELLNMLYHPWLYVKQTKQGDYLYDETNVKAYAKRELRPHINFPHIIEYRTELGNFVCVHCGTGFQTSDYRRMKNHMETETMCDFGFSNQQCVCGRKFDTLEEAHNHRMKSHCLLHRKEREQRQKELEEKNRKEQEKREKEKEEKERKKEEKRKQRAEKKAQEKAEKKKLKQENKRKCELCNVVFRGKKEEERHMNGKFHKLKANPNVLSCSHCEMTFVRQKHLDDHLLTKKHLHKIQECPSSSLPKTACASSCEV